MGGPKEKAPAGGPRLKIKQISRTHSTAHRTINLLVDAALAADDALVREDAAAMRVGVSLLARHSKKLVRVLRHGR